MIVRLIRVILVAYGPLCLLTGALASSVQAQDCQLDSIKALDPPTDQNPKPDNRAALNRALISIKDCLASREASFTFTVYQSKVILQANQSTQVGFVSPINSSVMIIDGQSHDAMESYLSKGLKVPSTGVYGVSTFGRIDAFTPPTDSKNDVYLQVMVNSASAVTFYKAQYLDRESVGGTIFLWLKKDDVLSVSALLTDTVIGNSVVLDNVYLSVARIN